MGYDLSTLNVVEAANKGTVVDITHPVSGEVLGIKITVAGSDSDIYRKAQRQILNKRLAQRAVKTKAEEIENESLELLVKCTLGWEGVEEAGAPIPFSAEAARSLYKKYPWLREQVDTAIADRSLFLGN